MTYRQPRKMPTMVALARHLGIHDDPPACFRCGWAKEDAVWKSGHGLERAHIIDRWADGLDAVQNLRPLCHECHRTQPIFEPGQEEDALLWFSGVSPFMRDLLTLGLYGWSEDDPSGMVAALFIYDWALGETTERVRRMAHEHDIDRRHRREYVTTCRHLVRNMPVDLKDAWWDLVTLSWDEPTQDELMEAA